MERDAVPLFKKYTIHAVFLVLMASVAWQSRTASVTDRNSLLYNLIAGEEIVEGPLDPAAYASTDTPGVGGSRIAAIDAKVGVELITFEDPEVEFASTLGGNAVVAPHSPLVPEPGSEEEETQSRESHIYTVQEGDTIASIAAQFNISTNTVLWANGLSNREVIKVGDHIKILPTTGVEHSVSSGDTLLAIAQKYNSNAKEIAEYNGIADTSKLSIGQKLIVPDGYIAPQTAPRIVPADTQLAETNPEAAPPSKETSGSGFSWPTTSQHISQYFRWGHTGIDIDNRSRPPIYAAQAGTVEFAGWLGGYGKLIIVNHGGGLQTYYAHNDAFYVSKGQQVSKGQAIAKMGSTGRSTGPHVHFEVRRHGSPVNPLSYY